MRCKDGLARAGDAIRMLITRIAADKAFPCDINRVQVQPDTKKP